MAENSPAGIFRQRAVDRLSSPEQLDRLMVVARPRDWIALGTLLTLVLLALAWSIFGTIPTRVDGNGILVGRGGQIFVGVAPAEGNVVRLHVRVGDSVGAGDLLAEIDQPDLVQQLANARAAEGEAAAELASLRTQVGSYRSARVANTAARQAVLREASNNARRRAEAIEAQLKATEGLRARGFATEQSLVQMRQQAAAARQDVSDAEARAIELDAQEIGARNVDARDVQSAEVRLAEARRQVRDVALQIRLRGQVRSPTAGRVTEIKAPVGTRVSRGTQLVSVESGQGGLQLVLFLPPDTGKMVRPGMSVRVSPSVARREEYGTMTGRVVEVSEFPSTPEAMRALLQNDQLVTQFSKDGAPFAARIDLVRDPATATGYAWAGGRGPAIRLTSGTLATAQVTTAEQAPIAYLIPLARRTSGL